MTEDARRQQVSVYVNPLKLFEWEGLTLSVALPEDPTLPRLLEYLCSRQPSDLATLKERYKSVSKQDTNVHMSFEEAALVENFYKPLHHAKNSYILGNGFGAIALCGLIAEKVAIFMHMRTTEDEAARVAFERRDQSARVKELKPHLAENVVQAFGDIRAIRKKYLHYWTRDVSSTDKDAVQAYGAAVTLVQAAVGVAFDYGGVVLIPQVEAYLTQRGIVHESVHIQEEVNAEIEPN